MAFKALVVALSAIVATSAAASTQPTEPTAPAGSPETRYCMRVEAQTGSRIEGIECWTREEWAEGGVDVDKDWPKEGVRVING
jgi:hypothetical protein